MTLQQLYYVIKIAEFGSMNKAADYLFVSQPTLTNSVKELEREINMTIFIRTSKGISITQQGELFLNDAKALYNQYLLLEDKYKHETSKRKFAVSTQHFSFAVKCFVSMVKSMDMDNYSLAINETKTLDVIEDVGKAKSELGVLYLSNFNRKYITKLLEQYNLEFEEITRCNACVYVHSKHPLANLKEISLEQLEDYPCLSFDQGEENLFYLSEEILTENEFLRSIKASDRATILNLMIGLDGYTLCPGIVYEQFNGDDCRIIPYKENANNPNRVMEIGYIHKKGALLSKAAQQYIDQLHSYFN